MSGALTPSRYLDDFFIATTGVDCYSSARLTPVSLFATACLLAGSGNEPKHGRRYGLHQCNDLPRCVMVEQS